MLPSHRISTHKHSAAHYSTRSEPDRYPCRHGTTRSQHIETGPFTTCRSLLPMNSPTPSQLLSRMRYLRRRVVGQAELYPEALPAHPFSRSGPDQSTHQACLLFPLERLIRPGVQIHLLSNGRLLHCETAPSNTFPLVSPALQEQRNLLAVSLHHRSSLSLSPSPSPPSGACTTFVDSSGAEIYFRTLQLLPDANHPTCLHLTASSSP